MFVRIFTRCWLAITAFLFTAVPLWAQEAEGGSETQEWVISYAIMILFLTLMLLILLRPTTRDDSAFSFDELQTQKNEEMKKIKGGH